MTAGGSAGAASRVSYMATWHVIPSGTSLRAPNKQRLEKALRTIDPNLLADVYLDVYTNNPDFAGFAGRLRQLVPWQVMAVETLNVAPCPR